MSSNPVKPSRKEEKRKGGKKRIRSNKFMINPNPHNTINNHNNTPAYNTNNPHIYPTKNDNKKLPLCHLYNFFLSFKSICLARLYSSSSSLESSQASVTSFPLPLS